MTISDAQAQVDRWIQQYGVRYFNELTNMAMLTEEVGELARLIARTHGEQSFKNEPAEDPKEMIADEMADIIFVVICLANQMGISLEGALVKNLDKKTKRDSERHWKNENLHP